MYHVLLSTDKTTMTQQTGAVSAYPLYLNCANNSIASRHLDWDIGCLLPTAKGQSALWCLPCIPTDSVSLTACRFKGAEDYGGLCESPRPLQPSALSCLHVGLPQASTRLCHTRLSVRGRVGIVPDPFPSTLRSHRRHPRKNAHCVHVCRPVSRLPHDQGGARPPPLVGHRRS